MSKCKLVVLAEREGSSMTSAWMEYLCLEKLVGGKFRLFTGRYDCLAEANDYYNEKTEEFDLPEVIDGKPVVGIEDGEYVIGGDLSSGSDSEATNFVAPDEEHVTRWLREEGWSDELSPDELATQVRALQIPKKERRPRSTTPRG